MHAAFGPLPGAAAISRHGRPTLDQIDRGFSIAIDVSFLFLDASKPADITSIAWVARSGSPANRTST
ncbi:Hypothetical protein AT6N2_L0416 [Agrobacterium tumefaciens]|nr:Hypothetical protein AT6N2_L0416 [Agrobacterium tumefaciens]